MLLDYLMQAVEEYNEAQPNEEMHLDWWEVIDEIDKEDEQAVKLLTHEIKRETTVLRKGDLK